MFVVWGRLEGIWGVGLSPSFSSPKEFGLALWGDLRVGSAVYRCVKQVRGMQGAGVEAVGVLNLPRGLPWCVYPGWGAKSRSCCWCLYRPSLRLLGSE